MAGDIRIGISGWRYAGWRGVFYPPKLPQRRELEFAAGRFRSIEINGTHYSLQRPKSFLQWASETPDDFIFSIKGSRFITHMKKLRDIEDAMANFFAQGMLAFGPKLGPILWQFPPQFQFDPARFESFFRVLPRTLGQAAKLACFHGPRLQGRAITQAPRGTTRMPLRHCVEIRHESFAVPAFVDLLRRHKIGLVVADTVEWPLLMDVTSDFVYCRLHGAEQLYASGYEEKAIAQWADRVVRWATGQESHNGRFACTDRAPKLPQRDVYVYFDNDMKVRAPFDAMALQERVNHLLPECLHRNDAQQQVA
ncbi:DUF72 domain-containing protein [Terriglobus sp. 2YAB30_2]|uniref:DUF72 domain-containing protein n=1 Tax=Terriglobus sp. 2YAB30_2 TaxID=3233023 RepID=UPI003F99559C